MIFLIVFINYIIVLSIALPKLFSSILPFYGHDINILIIIIFLKLTLHVRGITLQKAVSL